MKKIIAFLSLLVVVLSCQHKVTAIDIAKINGYWEIEKVVFPDGKQKDYAINETFDYFNVKNNIGYRKKVRPQLDGTFLVNNDSENVLIKEEKDKYFIEYSTNFNKWKEELSFVSEEKLVLINANKNEYHYKRATAINILGDGKKVK
jgi:hypothetical protein